METCSYYKNKLHCTGLTKLERKVVSIINDNDYPKGYMKDVMQGGCVNGSVNELIYYTDTVAWYKKYRDEIDQMVQELMDENMTLKYFSVVGMQKIHSVEIQLIKPCLHGTALNQFVMLLQTSWVGRKG